MEPRHHHHISIEGEKTVLILEEELNRNFMKTLTFKKLVSTPPLTNSG